MIKVFSRRHFDKNKVAKACAAPQGLYFGDSKLGCLPIARPPIHREGKTRGVRNR